LLGHSDAGVSGVIGRERRPFSALGSLFGRGGRSSHAGNGGEHIAVSQADNNG
jgi:hypothetical protein